GDEAGEPGEEEVVQGGLDDADRGIGPDGVEPERGVELVSQAEPYIVKAGGFGIALSERHRPLVHVHTENRRLGRPGRHGEGDGAISAAEVEKVAGRGRGDRKSGV